MWNPRTVSSNIGDRCRWTMDFSCVYTLRRALSCRNAFARAWNPTTQRMIKAVWGNGMGIFADAWPLSRLSMRTSAALSKQTDMSSRYVPASFVVLTRVPIEQLEQSGRNRILGCLLLTGIPMAPGCTRHFAAHVLNSLTNSGFYAGCEHSWLLITGCRTVCCVCTLHTSQTFLASSAQAARSSHPCVALSC